MFASQIDRHIEMRRIKITILFCSRETADKQSDRQTENVVLAVKALKCYAHLISMSVSMALHVF